MPVAGVLKANTYRDSVALMVLSSAISDIEGVEQASAMMATPANLEILRATGLYLGGFDDAGPNDLCIGVEAVDSSVLDTAIAEAERRLARAGGRARVGVVGSPAETWRPRSFRKAVESRPEANLALISVPGEHAAHEARQALLADLHVFLFSDNVPLDEEVALKQLADERGLLLMGPDCGTALLAGTPLGFANAVRRGPIGVVGSSGTGLQEVTSLIHRLGGGISHAIGTGGHDLYAEVGGRTFLAALDALVADPATTVLVAIAKPGDPGVQKRVLERLSASGKPSVVYFLGASDAATVNAKLTLASDLEHTARCTIALANGDAPPPPPDSSDAEVLARAIVADLTPGQRAVRGLFAGGTLAQEAAASIGRALQAGRLVTSEHRPGEVLRLGPHRVLDLGDDAYTRGRPHPLIDPRLRNAEIEIQTESGEVALFLIDVILGTGSHPDPAAALAPALAAARSRATAAGQRLHVVASVCGTDQDAQGFQRQRTALEANGVQVVRSSSMAAAVAGAVAALLAEATR